jgi:serine phosphatase RsbU (regulator of sigma subunit)
LVEESQSGRNVPESARVLLVEEDPGDVAHVRSVLERSSPASFTVVAVADARAAAVELRARPHDLILLGLSRPAARYGGGFDAIRDLAKTVPVVVLSGLDDEDVAVEAVHRGAQDYLVKDRLTADLLVRSIRYARERHRLLADQTRRLQYELRVAAFVQQSFLPATVPEAPGHDIGAHLHASGQVGGDFYDFIDLPPDRVAVAVGDASGKGIPGAILMAETQGVLRAEAATCATPVELVRTLNRALLHDQDQDRFVTLFYGVLAVPTGRFTFVNAGHPRALLLDGATESALVSTGPPLRLFADAAWDEQTVTLGAGARLVIYSDGVTEAQNNSELFFDLGGVRAVMSEHLDCPAVELAKHICHAAERFERGNPDPGDDKTVVVVRALKP